MKNLRQLLPIAVLSATILSSCADSDEMEVQYLRNSSVEEGDQSPYSWFSVEKMYEIAWSKEEAFDGERSLKIISNLDDAEFAYWGQSFETDIPVGKKLRLRAQIKLNNVQGDGDGGAIIALRGDSDEESSGFFYTTQGNVEIKGTQDWTPYSVEMLYPVDEDINRILVFLILGSNTSGEAYFDQITLKPVQ